MSYPEVSLCVDIQMHISIKGLRCKLADFGVFTKGFVQGDCNFVGNFSRPHKRKSLFSVISKVEILLILTN